MKTTMIARGIANPRRTTLTHVKDTGGMTAEALPAEGTAERVDLPSQTANPRRTVLMEAPRG